MIRRDSRDADLDALQRVADRLQGFDDCFSIEWIDGALTALAAGPRVPALDEIVLHLFDDTWARTFADPEDDAAARAPLAARWHVLLGQLDPDALWADPQILRLAPVLLVAQDGAGVPLGADWSAGFGHVVTNPRWSWPALGDGEMLALITRIGMLALDDSGPENKLRRQDLVDSACFAAQDLRLYWMDHAPRTAPRQAEPKVGRNDPCPCGSGRKYKKCHGAGGGGG